MRTVWFGFKLRGIRFRVRIRTPQFLPRQRGEAFEFEFSSKRNDIVFPEGGEGGVQVRVREVAPREGAGGGSSSSNSARKNIKFLFPRGRGNSSSVRVQVREVVPGGRQFEFEFTSKHVFFGGVRGNSWVYVM